MADILHRSSGHCDFNYDHGVFFRELDAGASQPGTRPTTCRAGRGLRRLPGDAAVNEVAL